MLYVAKKDTRVPNVPMFVVIYVLKPGISQTSVPRKPWSVRVTSVVQLPIAPANVAFCMMIFMMSIAWPVGNEDIHVAQPNPLTAVPCSVPIVLENTVSKTVMPLCLMQLRV